jgi:hypothetical protein
VHSNQESLSGADRQPGPTTTDAADQPESRRSPPALFEAFCGVGFLLVRLIAPACRSAFGGIVVRGLKVDPLIPAGAVPRQEAFRDCHHGR